jgi:hypothetical protein
MKGYVLVSIALAWLAAAGIAGCVGQPTALAPAEGPLPAITESVETRETQSPTSEATGLPTPGLEPQKEEISVTPQPSLEASEINLPAAAEPSVRLARADLAQRLGLAPEAIKLVSVEAVEWSDASLGCPQPGMMYAQVITPGFLVVLEAGGATYTYHTDMGRFAVLCEKESEASTGSGTTVSGEAATPDPDSPYYSLVMKAVEDLAGRLSIQGEEIELLEVKEVVWPDSSLGCPQPGMAYKQVPMDGLLIRLRVDGRIYEYHSGGSRDPFLCEQTSPVSKSTPIKLDEFVTPPSSENN